MALPVPRSVPVARAAAAAGGQLIGVLLGGVGRLRRGKSLHPRGSVHEAVLTVWGTERPWEVPLLDRAGEHRCLVRVSRAAGLPSPLPDVHGLAVRLEETSGTVDLLLSTTGVGPLTRFVLLPGRTERRPMTTLLPVRTPTGPLQLRLTPAASGTDARTWLLSTARGRGPWEPVGRLVATAQPVGPDPDPPLRFDPVHHLPAGVSQYPWVRLVRDPAYVRSRQWSPRSRWRRRPGA
ncbi:hypothetical protein SAMN05216184_1276 [Georgenia satyanarayanai]|uniref:Phosphodiesterase n=1 Tax=Georgenia satyanarayanai TaxID=860221 RepID=A0A2Y9ATM6_9MICO|nr:hypothetical protein [Georgenia satyanarayanai]PYF95628.1 hypothetical protein A8987_1276 [Georgenia satyanarayanai]SSA47375.1 hypothetical protein SAMN05216184_1276 [Georgenia satyanarayanai]